MAIPPPKFAVYYGTHRLRDGSLETLTAEEVATLYGVEEEDYLAIALTGPLPFINGPDELSYYHLKPLSDVHLYFNAIERYNTDNGIYWDEDFAARENGKWADRPIVDSSEET